MYGRNAYLCHLRENSPVLTLEFLGLDKESIILPVKDRGALKRLAHILLMCKTTDVDILIELTTIQTIS